MAETVLVVDDDVRLARALLIRLRSAGFEVHHAGCGAAALECAERIRPTVIVLDIALPDFTGIQVCQRLRAVPHLHGTPVIFLSANSSADDRRQAAEAGGTEFFSKPCPAADLLAVLRAFCSPPAPPAQGNQSSKSPVRGDVTHEESKP